MVQKKWYDNAVMVNRDPNWYGAAEGETAEECRASLENYLSKYEGAVTDVLIGALRNDRQRYAYKKVEVAFRR